MVHAGASGGYQRVHYGDEIVVPIRVQGKVVGEIDIDSHTPAAFTEADRSFIEEAARIVGAWMEPHFS